MAIASIEGHTLKISLLRPSEAIVVKIEMESFHGPNLVMPTKTKNMVETLRRIPGIVGIAPGIFLFVFGIGSFVGMIVLLHLLNADPPNHIVWPLVSSVGCFAISVAAYFAGVRLIKKVTPDIPYRFLTADWHDVSRERETKDRS